MDCNRNGSEAEVNVFVIPSWYPTQKAPIAGIFVQEQLEAIAELAPDVQVCVSTWASDSCGISLRSVSQTVKALREFVRSRSRPREVFRNGVAEFFAPALFWSSALPYGGIKQLVAVNRVNFRAACRRFGRIDIMHAQVSYPGGFIAYLLAREFGVPYVLTEQMSPFPFPVHLREGKPRNEIVLAFEGAAASIAISPSLAERVASFGLGKPCVIPNLVDERRFRAGKSASKRLVFFTLGGLSDQKGIPDLLDAIALWNPSAEEVEFRIGGDGPKRREYGDRASRLGIADRVRWLGAVSRADAPRLFRECDVFVLPSKHETFGVVYAEATASGKPVIATRCGGPEFIVNQGNGVLVEVGDVGGLADAMRFMAAEHASYNPEAIRQDCLERFSRQAVVPQIVSLYRRLLGREAAVPVGGTHGDCVGDRG